jgi:DNA-binding transcriptional LysR family regulator
MEAPVSIYEASGEMIDMLEELASVRLKDLEAFVEVARAKSIREAARRLGTSSGQVSKVVQNLERRLGGSFFKRSASGVLLTAQGAELHVLAQELLATGEKMAGVLAGKGKRKYQRVLAIAGTAFLNTYFTAGIVGKMVGAQESEMVFRFLDLAPDQFVPVGLRGGFELVVHFGNLAWPNTWTSKSLGRSRWTLCVRQDHPVGKAPTLKSILEYPFIVPSYWTNDGLAFGNDQFPIAMSKRKTGFETSTADAAVSILRDTNQVAFLPDILVRPFIRAHQLRELRPSEIQVVEKELFLSVKSDSVPSSIFRDLSERMTVVISENKKTGRAGAKNA